MDRETGPAYTLIQRTELVSGITQSLVQHVVELSGVLGIGPFDSNKVDQPRATGPAAILEHAYRDLEFVNRLLGQIREHVGREGEGPHGESVGRAEPPRRSYEATRDSSATARQGYG